MNGDKKKNSEKKSVNSTNTMSKSLLSLKDIALGIEKTELNQQENSLSKSQEDKNDKLILGEEKAELKSASEINFLLEKLEEMGGRDTPAGSTVTVRISKKSHKILSELKLDDDFGKYRYGDILEALLHAFIEKNKTELKKKLSKRQSSF